MMFMRCRKCLFESIEKYPRSVVVAALLSVERCRWASFSSSVFGGSRWPRELRGVWEATARGMISFRGYEDVNEKAIILGWPRRYSDETWEDKGSTVPTSRPPWWKSLKAAISSRNTRECMEVLKWRCSRTFDEDKTGRMTSAAFTDAAVALPPEDCYQIYLLAKDHKVVPTRRFAASIIRNLSRLGMSDRIADEIREMVRMGLQPHPSTYFKWAVVRADVGDIEGVDEAVRACRAANLPVSDHFAVLAIKSFCKARQLKKANEILQLELDDGRIPDEAVWRALVHCYGIHGKAGRGAQIFQRMVDAGIVPSAASWGALINAFADSNLPEEAETTLEKMMKNGVVPYAQTYNALIKAYIAAKDAQSAMKTLEKMQKDGVRPTTFTWGATISAFAASKDPRGAREVIELMKRCGETPGIIHYTALLSACRAVGDAKSGFDVLEEIESVGLEPNQVTLTEMIQSGSVAFSNCDDIDME